MPRESASKKTAAKKKPTTRKVAAKKRTTTVKRAAVSRTKRTQTTKSTDGTTRKAPTKITEKPRPASAPRFPKLAAGVLVFGLVIVGGSIALGMSGSGEINVDDVISERGAQVTIQNNESGVETVSVPVADGTVPKKRNGGLNAKGKSVVPPPNPTPEPVATSTEATASSTDQVADGDTEVTDTDVVAEESAEGEVAGATDTAPVEDDTTTIEETVEL